MNNNPFPSEENQPPAPRLVEQFTTRVANVAGVEQLEGFSLRDLFSEVFKKHTEDELEEHFTVGTSRTTPDIKDVDVNWPKPWVFFRTFAAALLVYIGFVQAWGYFRNMNLIPALIIIGSFAIPFATVIFFFEANVRRNVSLYQVIRLVFFGGVLSIIFSLLLHQLTSALGLGWLGASVAALSEEPSKLLPLLLVVNIPRYRYTLNGLLFGAAIGTGFEAFESAGYALRVALSADSAAMLDNIFERGVTSPAAHIVWTAICAAALWKIKGPRPFRLDMVQNPKFLRVFFVAVTLHMVWNLPFSLPFYGKPFLLGLVAWFIVLSFIQDGLKQLALEKAAALSPENPVLE
jgi:protease PrsW